MEIHHDDDPFPKTMKKSFGPAADFFFSFPIFVFKCVQMVAVENCKPKKSCPFLYLGLPYQNGQYFWNTQWKTEQKMVHLIQSLYLSLWSFLSFLKEFKVTR